MSIKYNCDLQAFSYAGVKRISRNSLQTLRQKIFVSRQERWILNCRYLNVEKNSLHCVFCNILLYWRIWKTTIWKLFKLCTIIGVKKPLTAFPSECWRVKRGTNDKESSCAHANYTLLNCKTMIKTNKKDKSKRKKYVKNQTQMMWSEW